MCIRDRVKRGKEVYVVKDAIKELPKIPLPFDFWEKKGVKMITLAELKKMIG